MPHPDNVVAETLRAHRKRLGLTQEQLAAKCNTTPPLDLRTTRSDLAKYERGLTRPSAAVYLKLVGLR